MQAALEFDAQSFGALLSQPHQFTLDLSNATLLDCIDAHIDVKQRLSPNYGKGYFSLIRCLKGLEFAFHTKLMPIHVTDLFWSHFHSYMYNVLHYDISTITTLSSQLISTLTFASRHGCKVSETYNLVKLSHHEKEKISLTLDEISHIYHYDIDALPYRKDKRESLKKVRDGFVLSCNLGQRHSDMIRIDKSNFDRSRFSIVQQKTGNKAKLNIDKISLDPKATYNILERYGYKFPYPVDINNYNKHLRLILKHIGGEFNEEIVREEKIFGEISTKRNKKYELIASHTARRSFVTNNILRGFREIDIRRATGHSDSRSFEKYICLDD